MAPRDVVGAEDELDDIAPGARSAGGTTVSARVGAIRPDQSPGRVARRVGAVVAVAGDRQHDRRTAMGVEARGAADDLARKDGRVVDRGRPDQGPGRDGNDEQPAQQHGHEKQEDDPPGADPGPGGARLLHADRTIRQPG
jgi:hypothetical protein